MDASSLEALRRSVAQRATAQLQRSLPPITLTAGLVAAAATGSQAVLGTGHFRPWALFAHLVLAGVGLRWCFRAPRDPNPAAFVVTLYLISMIGSFVISTGRVEALMNLGAVSIGIFYFIIDPRFQVLGQAATFAGLLVGLASIGPSQEHASIAIGCVVLWGAGLALHLGRRRVLFELERTHMQLASETEEKRRAQQEALDAKKLESLGVMAGGVAHDFNNLLVGIVGGAELAESELEDRPAAVEAIQYIQRSSRSAQELCRKLLEFAGGKPLELAPVSVNSVVEEGVRIARGSLPLDADLRTSLSDPDATVRGDAVRLSQAVANLITNAAEALEGGKGNIAVSICVNDEKVAVRVADDGPGVPAEGRDRIFDPFYTTKPEGRGLGLASVAGTVRSHGGEVSLEDVAVGSAFVIRLPRTHEQRPKERPSDGVEQDWRGSGRVLVVDDERAVREVLGRLLETLGFEVVLAESGETGVSAVKAAPGDYSAAIVDSTMPGMDGVETMRELRSHAPALGLVLVSGHAAKADSLEPQGWVFLGKPFKRAEVASAVQRALGV